MHVAAPASPFAQRGCIARAARTACRPELLRSCEPLLPRCCPIQIHSRKMNLTRGIDLKKIADKMTSASGAELKACCTEAGMFALRERRVHVTQEDFEMAVAKVTRKDGDKDVSLRKLWK